MRSLPIRRADRVATIVAAIAVVVLPWMVMRRAIAQATPPSAPPAAYSVGTAYGAVRGKLVVFGGYLNGTYVGDTWEWDGERWTLASSEGPEPRALFGLAYDGRRGRTVLFGGTSKLAPDA